MPKFSIVDAIMKKKPVEEEMGEEMPMGDEMGMEEEAVEDEGLEQCAMELIDAVKGGDVPGVIGALRAAFHILDAEPHEEGEHLGEEEEMPEEEEIE
jgi:hypothetical protein